MLWRCPACNRQTEEPICSRCQTPMESGEPSDATALIKETCGSVLFLAAVICFTAAIVISVVFSLLPTKPMEPVNVEEIPDFLTEFEEDVGITINADLKDAIVAASEDISENGVIDVEAANEKTFSLPLLSILACVGLWLLLVQGYNDRVSLQKGGPICLKIVTIIGEVVSIILAVSFAILCVGLWIKRPELVAVFNEQGEDVWAKLFAALLSNDVVMWVLLILCGVIAVASVVAVLFFIFATKTVNSLLYTAKTGNFGKKASLFVGVILCVLAVMFLADGCSLLEMGNWNGIAVLLNAVAYLLFAITLFIYRSRAHTLMWEQPAFTGETAAGMPSIPAGIRASDLMNERPAAPTPVVPVTPVKTNPQQPRRTLNEPFTEESLEPKPMTANGCCPKCGTPIPDNTFFCLHCGQKLNR